MKRKKQKKVDLQSKFLFIFVSLALTRVSFGRPTTQWRAVDSIIIIIQSATTIKRTSSDIIIYIVIFLTNVIILYCTKWTAARILMYIHNNAVNVTVYIYYTGTHFTYDIIMYVVCTVVICADFIASYDIKYHIIIERFCGKLRQRYST